MKNFIQPVKGTREFYPEDMALRNFINDKVRQASQAFGYQEWDGPFIEPIDLYAAKSGDELVKKQSFVFSDRGGDQVTLRPELTPSLARMIAKRQNELTLPVRWWSFGPFWRYEQPQRGRTQGVLPVEYRYAWRRFARIGCRTDRRCGDFFQAGGLKTRPGPNPGKRPAD